MRWRRLKKWSPHLKTLINKLLKSPPAPAPFVPAKTRVYSIGDIHGRVDLLESLVDMIDWDAIDFVGQIVVVYLGDFIDRGQHSKEVIDFLINHKRDSWQYIYLRGNHEQTLLDFLREDGVGRSWLNYGGQATLASYGVAINKVPTKQEHFIDLQEQLREKLPETHHRFMLETKLVFDIGNYFFVHAGINPRYPLTKQSPADLLWIRDDFTTSTKAFEKIIVHGHTISESAELLSNRIGIDTGAYATGILTCLVLEGDQQRLLQTPGQNQTLSQSVD